MGTVAEFVAPEIERNSPQSFSWSAMVTSPYRMLVESSSRLADVNLLDDVSKDCIDDANNLVERIRSVLDATQSVAFQECEVPVEFNKDFFSHHVGDIQNLRNLSRAMRFAADVAALKSDFNTVAQYGINILDLANATRRGGLIVDHLVAIAISGCGVDLLRSYRNRFEGQTCDTLIGALNRYEREREPYCEIAARDARWEAESGYQDDGTEITEDGLLDPDCQLSVQEQRVLFRLVKAFGNQPKAEIEATHVNQDLHDLAIVRLLSIELALRSWKCRTGRYPHDLTDLAPDIFSSVPRDPFTDNHFLFRSTDSSFELYSTGPDKNDSGGRFAPWFAVSNGGYDLCLDAQDYRQDGCTLGTRRGLIRRLWSRLRRW